MSAADAVTGDDARSVARLRGLLSSRSSLPDRLDFACAGRLQQDEALARGFLRIQVALSFVLDLQAGPFIRIHGLEVGSFELAIGAGCGDNSARSGRRIFGSACRYGSEYRRVRTGARMGDLCFR